MLKAEVYFQKEYFNRNAMATIPASWKGEVIEGLGHLNNNWSHFQVYSYGDTKQEVIDDLKEQLKDLGIKGVLKVI